MCVSDLGPIPLQILLGDPPRLLLLALTPRITVLLGIRVQPEAIQHFLKPMNTGAYRVKRWGHGELQTVSKSIHCGHYQYTWMRDEHTPLRLGALVDVRQHFNIMETKTELLD